MLRLSMDVYALEKASGQKVTEQAATVKLANFPEEKAPKGTHGE